MRNVLVVLLASATSIIALLNLGAYAADIPQRPVYKQPVVVAPVYNWTGCYLGANIGVTWGRAEANGFSGTKTGFAGGSQIGCDFQMGRR